MFEPSNQSRLIHAHHCSAQYFTTLRPSIFLLEVESRTPSERYVDLHKWWAESTSVDGARTRLQLDCAPSHVGPSTQSVRISKETFSNPSLTLGLHHSCVGRTRCGENVYIVPRKFVRGPSAQSVNTVYPTMSWRVM